MVGVISQSDLDSLAHVSVRARNGKVLLVVCYDEGALAEAFGLVGSLIQVKNSSDGVQISRTSKSTTQEPSRGAKTRTEVRRPDDLEEIVISSERFHEGNVGAKALNCGLMWRTLQGRVNVPESIALPYGCCEYFLGLPENQAIALKLNELTENLEGKVEDKLKEMRGLVMKMVLPPSDKETLLRGLVGVGVKEDQWERTWTCLLYTSPSPRDS